MEERGEIPRFNVFLTVVLTLVTCGVYVAVWFLRRRAWLNGLSSEQKLPAAPAVVLLVMYVTSVLFIPAGVFMENQNVEQLLNIADNILTLMGIIIVIALSFRVRGMIDWHYNYTMGMRIPISGVLTFFFTIFYLQYKINRLPE